MKVVILSEIDWSFLRQRHHFITEDFANQNDVVFVERVVSRDISIKNLKFFFLYRLKQFKKNNSKVQSRSNIKFVKSFYIPSDNIFARVLNRIWYKLFLEKHVKNALVYSFTPMIDMIEGYRSLCFDIIHNWWEIKWNQEVVAKRLNLYLEKASIVVTDSLPIYNRLNQLSLQSAPVLLSPGLGKKWLDFFQQEVFTRQEKTVKNKLVFFGNLRSNSDLSLIRRLSEIYCVDLYGIVQGKFKNSLQNCNFLGEFCQDQLMHKLLGYDAVILPYKNDEFSKNISPAKYFECLSLKIPIISNSKFDHLPLWNDLSIRFDEQDTITELKNNLDITYQYIENNSKLIDKVLAKNVWEEKIHEHNRALLNEFS